MKNRFILMQKWLILSLWLVWPQMVWAQLYIQGDVFSRTTNAQVQGDLDMGELRPAAGFFLLPYYIRFRFPTNNMTAWGIQLYTNNCPNKDWIPGDGLYGGLRGLSNPLVRIPLYWQVYSELQSNTTAAGGLAFYANTLRYWGLVKDISDADMALSWISPANLFYRTIVGYQGLGSYPRANRSQNTSPIYLYLGINVSDIIAPQQFGTVMKVDLYNLGVGISKGGYATPNPFTPVTGERTNFNFFLKEYNSKFSIRLFTLRGRLIRTINNTREWDGRNEQGQIVEGGLYIYQIETEDELVSGTVVVVK